MAIKTESVLRGRVRLLRRNRDRIFPGELVCNCWVWYLELCRAQPSYMRHTTASRFLSHLITILQLLFFHAAVNATVDRA